MKKTRTVYVDWTDDELIDHELQLDIPMDCGRGEIEGKVAEKMYDYNVAGYIWHVNDDITLEIIHKTEDFMEEQNLRYRVVQDDYDIFAFQLTDYYGVYVQFDVDLLDFTVELSYGDSVNDKKIEKAGMVFAAVQKILKDVQTDKE